MTERCIVRTPKHSANDEWGDVVDVHVREGERVVCGQPLLEIEESKAVVEIAAPAAGIVHLLVQPGARVPVGGPLAVVADRVLAAHEVEAASGVAAHADRAGAAVAAEVRGARFSRRAMELIRAHSLDPATFADAGLVDGAAVLRALAVAPAAESLTTPEEVRRAGNGRVALCGAGPGAYQLLSFLLEEAGTAVVGLLDDDPDKEGLEIYGVRTLGPLALMADLARADKLDAVICTTPTSIDFRRKVHALGLRAGVRLANAIHPAARFDRGVRIGGGNFFGAFCYVGAETTVGHYGFFSSGTTFEHHNRVGDGVTTGPGVVTSGRVTIGNHVKFGTGIHVESNLTIGDDVTVASGVAITADIAAGSVVKARGRQG